MRDNIAEPTDEAGECTELQIDDNQSSQDSKYFFKSLICINTNTQKHIEAHYLRHLLISRLIVQSITKEVAASNIFHLNVVVVPILFLYWSIFVRDFNAEALF